MGVGRIFSRLGPLRDFSNNFLGGGPNKVKTVFYHSKLRKQPFFTEILKIQGETRPSYSPPSDAHASKCAHRFHMTHSNLLFLMHRIYFLLKYLRQKTFTIA